MESIIKIASLITAIGTIVGFFIAIYKMIRSMEILKEDIKDQIKDLKEHQKELDKSQCKNYLVRFLKDKERGVIMSEYETERAYECYDTYIKHGGNGYMKKWWKKGMLNEN